jgi:hypothetical protein
LLFHLALSLSPVLCTCCLLKWALRGKDGTQGGLARRSCRVTLDRLCSIYIWSPSPNSISKSLAASTRYPARHGGFMSHRGGPHGGFASCLLSRVLVSPPPLLAFACSPQAGFICSSVDTACHALAQGLNCGADRSKYRAPLQAPLRLCLQFRPFIRLSSCDVLRVRTAHSS